MKHYLTYKDDKSDKFWQIETNGNSFTVSYGKTGTAGTNQTKIFDNEEKCLKEADKLLNEKLKKGYGEALQGKTQNAKGYLEEWLTIVDADDISKALEDHFSYLTETAADKNVLSAIMKEAKSTSCDSNGLKITFDEFEILASPPATNLLKRWPKSYQNLLKKHSTVTVSKYNVRLGEHNRFHLEDGWFDEVEENDDTLWVFAKAKNILCPIDDATSGNFWIYHPVEKNELGEPMIYYLEHDGLTLKDPQEGNAGSVFIDIVAKLLSITIDNEPTGKSYNNVEDWWNELDATWQKILEKGLWKDSEIGFSKAKIKKIRALDRLDIPKSVPIPNLEPLCSLPNLKTLRIYSTSVGSFDAITQLKKLKELEIHGGNYSLGILRELQTLEKLELRGEHITSLDALSKLTKLRELKLNCKYLKSIDVVANFSKLETLYMQDTSVIDISAAKEIKTLTHLELPASVKTLHPFRDLRNLYYLNIRSCKIPLIEMVDFMEHRKDGFRLLTYNYEELLYETFQHDLQGLDEKLVKWVLLWFNSGKISERATLVLLSVCYYLDGKQISKTLAQKIKEVKDTLEKKVGMVTSDGVIFLYEELLDCLKRKRLPDADALINTLSKTEYAGERLRLAIVLKEAIAKRADDGSVDSVTEVDWLFDIYHLFPQMLAEDCMILSNKFKNLLKTDYNSAKKFVNAFMVNFRKLESAKDIFLKQMKDTLLGHKINFLERFASDVLVLGILSKDEGVIQDAHELIPSQVTYPLLAFNLACNASLNHKKEDLLKFTKQAVALGKTNNDFMADSDFDYYKNDPDFLAALG